MTDFNLTGIGMTSQRTRDRLVRRLKTQGITDTLVLEVLSTVPRHIFVDEALAHRAYEDSALPIGHGQTLSQPFVVALMSQALLETPRRRVLEVGTGSGYQSAVLSRLVDRLFTIERVQPLLTRARERLAALDMHNIRARHGDGYRGWVEEAPFDGILVTAAPPEVPQALLDQLAVGGRMVVPVGDSEVQELKVYDRTATGIETQTLEYVRFVPLLKGLRGQ